MPQRHNSKLLNELDSMTMSHRQNIMQIAAFQTVGDVVYGINIAKIKEFAMIKDAQITKGLSENPYQLGIAVLRGESFPIINLTKWLGNQEAHNGNDLSMYDIFVVSEFNQSLIAFPVKKILTIASKQAQELERPSTTATKITYVTRIEINQERRVSRRRRKKMRAKGISELREVTLSREKLDKNEKICFVLDVEQMLEDIFPNITRNKIDELEKFEDIEKIETNKSLVVCEDSPVATSIIHKALDKTGVEAHYFSNGMEFQKWAIKNAHLAKKVGCVITDIEMPLMDGFQVVEYVKNEIDSAIPIIVNTSMSNIGVVKKLEDMGVNMFIPKTEPLRIYRAVKEFMEGKYV